MWSITTANAITHNSQIMMEIEEIQSAACFAATIARYSIGLRHHVYPSTLDRKKS